MTNILFISKLNESVPLDSPTVRPLTNLASGATFQDTICSVSGWGAIENVSFFYKPCKKVVKYLFIWDIENLSRTFIIGKCSSSKYGNLQRARQLQWHN